MKRSRIALPTLLTLALALVLGLIAGPTAAFNGEKVAEGPLTLTIAPIETVTQPDQPQTVAVTLTNAGAAALDVAVEMKGLADPWRAVGPAKQTVRVDAGKSAAATFRMAAGPGCLSALYPVHVHATFSHGGQKTVAHAVLVFETALPAPAAPAAATTTEMPVTTVPRVGAVPLAGLKTHRATWIYFDKPEVHLPVGWQGTDATSAASLRLGPVPRGDTRQAIHMHPPFRGGVGTVFAEYRLRLPAATPLRLTFFNAIRDSGPKEGASDGVTFRVWAGDEKLFERHTDAKVWTPGEADLSRFAGKEILLRLESHPGPRRHTSCDASYWGDPTVTAGTPPVPLTADERRQLVERTAAAAAGGEGDGRTVFAFALEGGERAAIGLGRFGVADGVLAFVAEGKRVVLDGLDIAVLGHAVGRMPSPILTEGVTAAQDAAGRLRLTQRLRLDEDAFDLTVEAWADGPALRLKVACPKRLTDIAPGAADQKAPRVYYGHGYCIVDPQPFTARAGGHNLATSHVGFEFEGGLALLTATTTPPDSLQVNPDARRYALHVHPDTTLTFLPSARGALDAAVRYRPLSDKRPADGVARKAGRFVFDVWGGRYAENTALLQRAFDYGLTDALVLVHTWQRWGYDYRLPDIYPPDPKLGTLEDLQALGRLCTARGVPWGLHDNYIDFYPDADGYTYDAITFNDAGRPRKAWINTGRQAQSYQFRPDRIQPFVDRNLALIRDGLKPTASFVDVFTSAAPFDYYDREGKFHSKVETRECWGRSFAAIRAGLGNHAPTVSEAGADFLTGWLDGADCQFLRLTDRPLQYCNALPCGDWDRVPWGAAVNRTRFSLHGVGYSNRYQGGRPRAMHGIESDDYLSAEMLTGHALMMDRTGLVRGAVRKYWLAQDVARRLATDEIAAVAFDGANIHRTAITWQSGARVWVNRGPDDWAVNGRTLPPCGYLAKAGDVESSIEKINSFVVEQSRGPKMFYVNGRGYDPDPALAIRPEAERVEFLGGRQFKMIVAWDAQRPAPGDLAVSLAFYQPQTSRLVLTGFQGKGGMPKPSTSQWQGRVVTGDAWTQTLPDDCPPGEYDILVSLIDPKARPPRRYRMWGEEDSAKRFRIGTLVVEGPKQGAITGMRLKKPDGPPPPAPPQANATATDFGVAQTSGAFRLQVEGARITVTPLPDTPPVPVTLRLDKILGRPAKVRSVHVVAPDGATVADRTAAFTVSGQELTLSVRGEDFAYLVEVE